MMTMIMLTAEAVVAIANSENMLKAGWSAASRRESLVCWSYGHSTTVSAPAAAAAK